MRIVENEIRILQQQTRMPFRYGVATMTEFPLLFLRVRIDHEGLCEDGFASDILPPKWFVKIPDKNPESEIEEMLGVIVRAADTAVEMEAASVFELWHMLYIDQQKWGKAMHLPPLLSHFGTSLVERAIIDAFAKMRQSPFARLLFENAFGMNLGKIHEELRGSEARDWLPEKPLSCITARHTIGLADPLTIEDCAENRIHDGLPQALSECIAHYGLRHFKVKICGDASIDLPRLRKMICIIDRHSVDEVKFTLDGNEQFQSLAAFDAFWKLLSNEDWFEKFSKRLLFVEQPFHRDFALTKSVRALREITANRPPILIDESDAELDSLPRALDLGYRGTSHKNCKGIFKGIANRCLIEKRQRENPDSNLMMSGEDLCNQGPIALLQDLAVMAVLGIDSVERNGHHYCKGISGLSQKLQKTMRAFHPDLYEPSAFGWQTLRLRGGNLEIKSIHDAPFGYAFKMHFEGLPSIKEWRG